VLDYFRRKNADKCGGHLPKLSLEEISEQGKVTEPSDDLIALDEALHRLETLFPRIAQIVKLRYFVGLTEEQTADVLRLSPRTIGRD
jgi:DNA-directed RNA polymerase specialized sigma24 family protein